VSLTDLPLFDMIRHRMAWLHQRQKVLAQNIANADTPGYRPNDLAPLEFAALTRSGRARLELAATPGAHLRPLGDDGPERVRTQRETFESAPAGNAVILEEQLLKVADTRLDYELTSMLYKKSIGLLSMALGHKG